MKTTSFLYYFSEKSISIDKIPPILQAFKVVLSCPTTEHGGIWVGPLLTSSKDMSQNTQETFDWVSSAVKTYLGYLTERLKVDFIAPIQAFTSYKIE